MASEMGSEELEPETKKLAEVESSYRIVYHQGSKLPIEYRNLIVAPFLNSLRYGNDLYKLIDKDAYFNNYSRYIEGLLLRPMAIVKLAMLKDETVLGWSLVEHKTVHYVWVKKEVRLQGICRALLPKEFNTISHITHKGINIWVKHFPDVGFNPWA
jgi:hypothetical protein